MLTPIAPPNHWPTRTTSSTSVTLTAGDAVLLCSNSSDAVVTTPNAASVPSMMYWVQKNGVNTALVEVKDHLGNVIVVLYVTGDSALIQSDGAAWRVIGGYLAPHSVHLARSTAQPITDGVRTRVAFNLAVDDVGGLADLTNGRAVVRRAGKYIVIASYMWWYPPATTTNVQAFGYINSVETLASVLYTGTFNAVRTKIADPINLAAGDEVDLYLLQASGADRNSRTETENRPTLHLIEVR